MSEKGRIKKGLFTVFFMFMVTFVFISILSLLHVLTRERIKLNESLVLKRAVISAAGLAPRRDSAGPEALYLERVREIKDEKGEIGYFEILDPKSSERAGYVLIGRGPGLWGEIVAMIGTERDLGTITGIEFTKQNETPGLGARIAEKWFKEQFRGKRAPFSTVPEGEPAGETEFQAITGASTTSAAVMKIINVSVDKAKRELREGG